MSENQLENLSIARNAKIGLFHLGSGMADVVATGIWNRIMISDLGVSATPVSLLLALRYFLTPLGFWSGHISDRRTVWGYRRLFWIWLGRLMMAVSVFTLGLATAELARSGEISAFGPWLVIILSSLGFSVGTALSGSVFLALIYDRAPEHQRGRAVGLIWAFLLLGFSVAGFFFGVLLPSSGEAVEVITEGAPGFSPDTLVMLFSVAALVLGGLWFFPLIGEEKRARARVDFEHKEKAAVSFRADLKLVWNNHTTRLFFWYLVLSFIFVFAQDAILEPFGGQVFGIDAKHTTRFAAYWGSMAIISTLLFLWLPRRLKWLTNNVMAYLGVAVIGLSYALFAVAGLAGLRPLITPTLIVMGLGLGIWNVGTLGLMMQLSPFGRAGTFLGFWTMVEIIARGVGVSSGGIIYDILLAITKTQSVSYVTVFVVSVIGLAASLWVLRRIDVSAFHAEYKQQSSDTAQVFATAMD